MSILVCFDPSIDYIIHLTRRTLGVCEEPGHELDGCAMEYTFTEDTVIHTGDDLASSAYGETLERVPALSAPVLALTGGSEDPAMVASAAEFILEGLHLTKRLNKEAAGPRATYRGRG